MYLRFKRDVTDVIGPPQNSKVRACPDNVNASSITKVKKLEDGSTVVTEYLQGLKEVKVKTGIEKQLIPTNSESKPWSFFHVPKSTAALDFSVVEDAQANDQLSSVSEKSIEHTVNEVKPSVDDQKPLTERLTSMV